MILSRLSHAIREQNWFAVALEFLIVLAGVVIGFQVSAWNEARQDREREALIVQRLQADFTDITQQTALTIDQLEARIIAGDTFARLLQEAPEGSDTEAFFTSLSQAVGTPVPLGRSATYAELLASGEMRLIRSESLRTALVEFDEQVRRQELAYASLARLITDNAGILVQAQSFSLEDTAALPPHLEAAIAEIRRSPDTFTAARLTQRVNQVNLYWHRGTLERAQAVLDILPALSDPEP
ncbi:hypothetical protein [Maricaulis parjimensis]|uniref:hypothetical protein n=1 Tax=Maricaulis parjimensis TaxID=144023 RepID=UPI00193A942E|nr:hypothetical protein [Maricaulis parjimensis]